MMKKAIIVGSTSGIGLELSKVLVREGYRVAITGRRFQLLDRLAVEYRDTMIPMEMDVCKTEELADDLGNLVSRLGGLDLLIISAGTGDFNEKLEYHIEKNTIDTNISGFTIIACWAFNYFRKQGYGQLAAITSVAGLRGNPLAPAYNATKAYQVNYLEGLGMKAGKLKMPIIVTDIRPGFVDTAMSKSDVKFWESTPQKAAEQIFTAIRKGKSKAYITRRWVLIGFLLKIIPRKMYRKM